MKLKLATMFGLLGCIFFLFTSMSMAQTIVTGGNEGTKTKVAIEVPDPLTEEAIRQLLSELDDKQVRTLLLKRLSDEAERSARELAKERSVSIADVMAGSAKDLGAFLSDVIAKAPKIPSEIAKAYSIFSERRGEAPLWQLMASLVASLVAGLLARLLATRLFSRTDNWIERANPVTLAAQVTVLATRLLLQLARVLLFAAGALMINAVLNETNLADRDAIARIIAAVSWTWVALVVAKFLFSPNRPSLRLCTVSDIGARFLTQRSVLLVGIFNFGFGFTGWLNDLGSAYRDSWHGFWVNLLFHFAIALSVWQGRSYIRTILSGDHDPESRTGSIAVRLWPAIMVILVFLHWFLVELIVSTNYVPENLFIAMVVTLLVMVGLPFLDQAIRAVAAEVFHSNADKTPVIAVADEATKMGVIRIARVVATIILAIFLLSLWHVDIVTLAEKGVGARFASSLINICLIIALSYGAWELVTVVTDRRIAMEKVAMGVGGDGDSGSEGEGGAEGARLGTLLPLVRAALQITIVVLMLLTVLGELGINVLPLLAGAGVVGIAIGFGAQTLVKDIVSGIFFLIDDAFRKGEYVDIGNAKGTVEKISVRSMQLRHHRGALNTIPFGEIRNVANYSRDWVVMKFVLRVTYDTNAEKVRKMIKKLGQELLEDPEYGHLFLEPLKSQGVVQMEDSAMIMPVKFSSRPGEQWGLRRLVLTKIHHLFEQNGIKFANREVTVRLEASEHEEGLAADDKQKIAGAASRVVLDAEHTK